MFKNVAATFIVFAFDATTNVPKTGDAANITAYVSKDYGAVTVLGDTSATEMDATNAPGYYVFTAAQAETNADCLLVSGKSSTSNIKVIGAPAVIYTRPTTGWLAPTTAGRTLVVDAAGLADANMVKAGPTGSGTAQTAGDVYSKVSGLTFTGANKVDASVRDWIGGTIPAVTVTGVPIVSTKYWNGETVVATSNSGVPIVDVKYLRGTLSAGAAGYVGPDWSAVNSAGATVNLSATTVATLTTYTGNTPQTGDTYGRLGAPAGASASADIAAAKADTAAIKAKTDNLPAAPASTTNITAAAGCALTSAYDFAKGTVAMTESYNTDGAAPTPVQALMLALQMLTEKSVSSTTLTVKKLDGSTTAATFTLSDATTPVSITRAT